MPEDEGSPLPQRLETIRLWDARTFVEDTSWPKVPALLLSCGCAFTCAGFIVEKADSYSLQDRYR
jgi:hypothetical protein